MHWFRLGTSSRDVLTRFTDLWIGLETLNQTLCNHFGIEMEYSTCDCCKKKVPILTGVKRLFKEVGDKNLHWGKLSKLRATTIHGSRPLQEIVSDLRMNIPSLEKVLYIGLNLILGLVGNEQSFGNIDSQYDSYYESTAKIHGPNLEYVDRSVIPSFEIDIAIIHTDTREFRIRHKPVISEDFQFKNDLHGMKVLEHLKDKIGFFTEQDGVD